MTPASKQEPFADVDVAGDGSVGRYVIIIVSFTFMVDGGFSVYDEYLSRIEFVLVFDSFWNAEGCVFRKNSGRIDRENVLPTVICSLSFHCF